jgi:hypothetical protein
MRAPSLRVRSGRSASPAPQEPSVALTGTMALLRQAQTR